MTVVVLHHDVIDRDRTQKSGFYGACAEVYEVRRARFRKRIAELAAAFPGKVPALEIGAPFASTFDDGGAYATAVVVEAGLSLLLSSGPTVRCHESDGVATWGRFAVCGRDPAESAGRLAQRASMSGMRALRSQALGVAKNALGSVYSAAREDLLRLRA